MSIKKSCGCKGIRTCLICEKQSDVPAISHKVEEKQHVFNYCSSCNLCWPNDESTATLYDFPLYLGKVKLVPEFCTKEEESLIIASIDSIPWMPSQSGRKKQDFGPKVNFKKKKVKVGDFKGFPKFTRNVINKLQDFSELSDFDPVELCNLEYTPERGSSIDPHVDDFWLWGERLVTVNLNSTTVLTLVPCSNVACQCLLEANCNYFQTTKEYNNETSSCKHLFQNGNPINRSFKYLPKNDTSNCKPSSVNYELLKNDLLNLDLSNKSTDDKKVFSPTVNKTKKDSYVETNCKCDASDRSFNSFEVSNSIINENKVLKENHSDSKAITSKKIPLEIKQKHSANCKITDSRVNSICNFFRICSNESEVCVRILLPPRSLFVLSGCARYNWFHEIKRQDVSSRRLAMTFRELSTEFRDEGEQSQCGKDLLLIAKNFYDL